MDIAYVLTRTHPGAKWILNGDTYAGLEWLDDGAPPTESEIAEKWKSLKHEYALIPIRRERDALLMGCDWTQVADAPVDTKAWAAYRQQLRDLPATIEDAAQPVEWPTPPA